MQAVAEMRELDYEKLSLVASKTENAVIITDKYGVTEWVNEAFTTITEFSFEEAIGVTPGSLLQGPDTNPEHIAAITEYLKTGESFTQEILNYTKSGKAYWLRLSITPVRNEFGEIVNYIAVETDITEEKNSQSKLEEALKTSQEAEEKLKEALEQQEALSRDLMLAELRFKSTFKQEKNIAQSLDKMRSDLDDTKSQLINNEKMATIGLLTAGIAHEINNPMNFVSSGVTALKASLEDIKQFMEKFEQLPLPEDVKQKIHDLMDEHETEEALEEMDQMVQDISTGTSRTLEIIRGLRISARGDKDQKSATCINDLLDSSLVLLKNKWHKRINVKKNFGPSTEIDCYPGPLSQVFTNLINNAIQAIPDEKKGGEIEISTITKGNDLEVIIKDNGTGIPEEIKDKIFEPSFTTKKAGEGTGLGMSISQDIVVHKHGGEINFNSTEGVGTEFTVTIPISTD